MSANPAARSENPGADRRASRRNILVGAFTLAASGASGAALSLSPGSRPSSELARLLDRLRAAKEHVKLVNEAFDRARAVWLAAGGDPMMPDALFARPEDRELRLWPGTIGRRGESPTFTAAAVEHYRTVPRRRHVETRRPATLEDGSTAEEVATGMNIIVSGRAEPWAEAQARADEIVAAWDAWHTEKDRLRDASGLTELLEADCAAGAAVCGVLAEIRDFRPATLADAVLKARTGFGEFGSAETIDTAIKEADTWPEELALSLMRDLTALGPEVRR